MPTVSVIMPAYNAENTIVAAIASVLSQTYSDLELIIVEDRSSDKTYGIISEIAGKDNRIRVIRNEKNRGASFSRNLGIREAHGEWIAFLDSDDLWSKNKLERQMDVLLSNSDAVISYTASAFTDNHNGKYSYIMPAEERTIFRTLLKKNLLSCSSVVVKSSVIRSVPMPGDHMHEDYFVWLHIVNIYQIAYGINEPLMTYRLSTSSKSGNRLTSAKMLYNTYCAYGYSVISSAFLTLRYFIHSVWKRWKINSSRMNTEI